MSKFGLPSTAGLSVAAFSVTIFFALSGFLITYLLLVERAKSGNVSVGKFYVRRILRIWPLYFLYLAFSILLIAVYWPNFFNDSLVWYLVVGANIPFIAGLDIPLISHYWSLAVEEQFYVFWPWLIRCGGNIKKRIIITLGVFVLAKLAAWIYNLITGDVGPYTVLQINRFDCMSVGALGAVFFFERNALFLRICYSIVAQIVSVVSLLLICLSFFHVSSLFDDMLVSCVTVVLILNVSNEKKSYFLADMEALDFLGKISFGIYVYHPFVIFLASKIFGFSLQGFNYYIATGIIYLFVLFLTISISFLSYKYFEAFFLNKKKFYTKIESSS